MEKDPVILIVDRHFGKKMKNLPVEGPIWIVDSKENHTAIQELRDKGISLTSFRDQVDVPPEQVVVELLDSIAEHHGCCSEFPKLNELRVIGAALSKEIGEWLEENSFIISEHLSHEFLCVRKEYGDQDSKDFFQHHRGLPWVNVQIEIIKFTSDPFPGWIEFQLTDAWGKEWRFEEKAPVISDTNFDENTFNPQPGVIACRLIKKQKDDQGRTIIIIDTSAPWGIEASDGTTRFDILENQMRP